MEDQSQPSSLTSIYHFKVLVPAAAAGRIIGKGGTTIAQLQREAGARVKLSKPSEFYPGTTERVCLISGPVEGILKINDFFMENFSSTSIKILVQNSTAGMIIGKGGSYIKQIKEESGAYVQISQKCTDLSSPERCVTIVGDLNSIRKACAMILSKIVEDSSTSNNTTNINLTSSLATTTNQLTTINYGLSQLNQHDLLIKESSSPPFNDSFNLTSCNINDIYHRSSSSSSSASSSSSSILLTSPFANNCQSTTFMLPPSTSSPLNNFSNNLNNLNITSSDSQINNTSTIVKSLTPDHMSCSTSLSGNCTSSSVLSRTPSPIGSLTDMDPAQIIDSIKMVLRVSGYGEEAISEISAAMSTLANYGVLGVGLGLI